MQKCGSRKTGTAAGETKHTAKTIRPRIMSHFARGQEMQVIQNEIWNPIRRAKSPGKRMKFVQAEFERPDEDNNGKLDVKRLPQSSATANRFVGKQRAASTRSAIPKQLPLHGQESLVVWCNFAEIAR